MMRTIFFILLYSFSFSSFLSAKIIEITNLELIQEYFNPLDDQSLVMWDVDHTLIFPSDSVLRPGNEVIAHELGLHYLGGRSHPNWNELISQVLSKVPFYLVDPQLPSLISSLQKKGIPTMAFTAMRTGSYGKIPSMENWRIDQLKCLGIDFSQFFPQHSGLNWQQTTSKFGKPAFKAGILCSDHLPKGPVLKTFFNTINWQPTQVIFFDDTLDCLISVEHTLKELNISFIGIHYHAAKYTQTPVNLKIAHYQYQTLAETGIWLTDEEAQATLQLINPKTR
jgi:hypothetical protein